MTGVGVIGLDHLHVLELCEGLVAAGAPVRAWLPTLDDLGGHLGREYPESVRADDLDGLLGHPGVDLVVVAAVNSERAALATAALEAGRDVLTDKPLCTSLHQLAGLRDAVARSGRRCLTLFGERHGSRAMVRALDLVQAGAIGTVVSTTGAGPHTLYREHRPDWFFDPARTGGILVDIGSHQVDQYLAFTGADPAGVEVAAATVANRTVPEHPGAEDWGELLLRGGSTAGYARLDYLTQPGLGSWGDSRLTVVGTGGTVEVRANVDVVGEPGGDHLIVVDAEGARRVDCRDVSLTWAGDLLADLADGTTTFQTQEHAFAVAELTLRAQAAAVRLGDAGGSGA